MKLALISCKSVINENMNMAYSNNDLEHQSTADLKYRQFPNQRSTGNGFSMTWQIMENNYILPIISSQSSTMPAKSEALLSLKEEMSLYLFQERISHQNLNGKRCLHPFTKEVSSEWFFFFNGGLCCNVPQNKTTEVQNIVD